jgi:hypothetical protein
MHDIIKHNHNFITGQITIYKGKSIRLKILKIISSNKKFNFKMECSKLEDVTIHMYVHLYFITELATATPARC